MLAFTNSRFRSLRLQLTIGFLLITIPLILLLLFNNEYAMKVVRNQISASNQNTIELYMNQIDQTLDNLDQYLYTLAVRESNLIYLKTQYKDESQSYKKAKIQIYQKLSADQINYNQLGMLFVYSNSNQDLIKTMLENFTYEERERVDQDLRELLANTTNKGLIEKEWFVLPSGPNYFLCRIIQNGGVSIGALVNTADLLMPLQKNDLGTHAMVVFTNQENLPLSKATFYQHSEDMDLSFPDSTYKMIGSDRHYLLVGDSSRMGNFNLVALTPDEEILENLPNMQRVLSLFPIAAFFLALLVLFFLRKIIMSPLSTMISAMKSVSFGALNTRIARVPISNEFDLMYRTFNNMVTEIQTLKISVYEEQINLQKAELKQLQLQVNPHFFLNSMNIIYNLARVQNYDLIKDMTLSLVKYFRYTFRGSSSFVLLQDEVEHIKNYLRIQELRFPGQLSYHISIEPSLQHCRIPLLIIQPLVENCIVHGMRIDQPLHIIVSANSYFEADENHVHIVIQDNGKGFPHEIMDHLLKERSLTNVDGEHVGIWNVQRRLKLTYPDCSSLTISNHPLGGAYIDIRLPSDSNHNDDKGGIYTHGSIATR